MSREARALATSELRSASRVDTTPRLAPTVRRWRVSSRVSISLIPTTPASSRYRCSSPEARHDEATVEASRTTKPDTWGRDDSTSSRFTP